MSYSHQKSFSWPGLLFFLAVFAALVVVLLPLGFHRGHGAHSSARAMALANAKSIVGGLMIFKEDRGSYPCDKTQTDLVNEGPKFLPQLNTRGIGFLPPLEEIGVDFPPKGDNANAYFAQLLSTNALDSEIYFFVPGMENLHKGDDQKDTRDTILAAGENGYAYIMTKDGKALSDTSSLTPLILAPVKTLGAGPIFDSEPFDGRFVYGQADGSATTGEIDEDGHAILKDHGPFFQTGPNSLFGNDLPIVKYPLIPR